jgi:hypothetical protein
MAILLESVEFVKRQLTFHQRRADKAHAEGQPSAHHGLARDFGVLLSFLTSPLAADIEAAALANGDVPDDLSFLVDSPTQVSPALLKGLPPELVEQLQISDTERFQWQVVDLINRTPDRIISIEVLLIALFKATGKVHERLDLSNRMYRMARKGMVYSVPGKKGWYTTIANDGQDIEPELPMDPPEGQS